MTPALAFRGSEFTAKKTFSNGSHRILSPEETVEQLETDGIKKRIGITRVANITGLDKIGIPVLSASLCSKALASSGETVFKGVVG